MHSSEIVIVSSDDDESVVEIFQNKSASDTKSNTSKKNTSAKTLIVTNGFENVKNELNRLVDDDVDDRLSNDDDKNYNFLMQELSDLLNSVSPNSCPNNTLIVPEITEDEENVVEINQKNSMRNGEENPIQIVSVQSLNHRINQWMDTSMEKEFVPPTGNENQKAFEGDFKNLVANNGQHELLELKYENPQSFNNSWMKTPIDKLELKILNKYLPIIQLTRISLPKNTNLKTFIKEQLRIDANDNGHDLKPLIHQNMVDVKQEVYSQLHPLNDDNQKVFICETCIKTFNSKDSFQEHMKNHHPENKIYKCDDCDYVTTMFMSMQSHRWTHTKKRPYRCPLCEYGSKTAQYINIHIRRIHTKERPFACPHIPCTFAGAFPQDLKNHIKNKHFMNDKAVSLDNLNNNSSHAHRYSKRNFSSVNIKKLKTHKEIDPITKMYPCTHCTFSTPYKNGLKVHLSQHETESFKCDACNHRFINKDQHIRNYHTLFPLNESTKCSFCKETFTNKFNMKLHLRTHANKKFKKCHTCLYITSSKKKFQIHMHDHKNNKLFTCNDCNKSFRSKKLLRQHQINFHFIINNY